MKLIQLKTRSDGGLSMISEVLIDGVPCNNVARASVHFSSSTPARVLLELIGVDVVMQTNEFCTLAISPGRYDPPIGGPAFEVVVKEELELPPEKPEPHGVAPCGRASCACQGQNRLVRNVAHLMTGRDVTNISWEMDGERHQLRAGELFPLEISVQEEGRDF